LRLSYTPILLSVSAAMGTVELTGLEMMFSTACQGTRDAHTSTAAATHQACVSSSPCREHNPP
jgi:hypothetical protein